MPNYIRIPNLAHTASYRNSLTKIITRLQKIVIIKYLEQVKLLKTNRKLQNISQILSYPKRHLPISRYPKRQASTHSKCKCYH
jgi:hypothetical protein